MTWLTCTLPGHRNRLFLLLLTLSLNSTGAGAAVSQGNVIQWHAETLTGTNAFPIERLSVLAWRDNAFTPVPFQIDEMAGAGLIWFGNAGLNREGRPDLFDGKDALLLWRHDAGSVAPEEATPARGRLLQRLRLPGSDRMFYLALDHPGRHGRRHVQHDVASGVTTTNHYRLKVDPDNELVWKQLRLNTDEGAIPVADALFIKVSAGLLFSGARLELDGDNLKPGRQYHKAGPLRSVVHSRTRVVVAGIPVMSLHMQTWRYPDRIEAHSHVELPAFYRATLKSPEVRVALRGSDGHGASLRTARGGKQVARVDGRLDARDRALIKRGLSTDASWIRFETSTGAALTTQLSVPEELGGIPLQLLFRDSDESGPLVGYGMTGWPPQRELRFTLRILFDTPTPHDAARPGTHPD